MPGAREIRRRELFEHKFLARVGPAGKTLAIASAGRFLQHGRWRSSRSSAALASSATSEVRADADEANIVVLMTDDQTVESMRVMINVNTLLTARRTTFTNNFMIVPALLSVEGDAYITGQYGHNHTIMGNAAPSSGYD